MCFICFVCFVSYSELKWEGVAGKEPTQEELENALSKHDLYV